MRMVSPPASPIFPLPNRRQILANVGTGLGLIGLAGLLSERAQAEPTSIDPLTARQPHFPARAKHVIHIYLNGGPSQVDTFDPKPTLKKLEGKALPARLSTERSTGSALPSPFSFQKYGRSGLEISELFTKTASAHADDLCIIRSMHANTPNHEQSMRLMNCGDERLSRPSYGAWLTYGLGSENRNLPGFVVLCPGLPVADVSNWRSAFLPGIFQGTHIDTRKQKASELIDHIINPEVTPIAQRRQLDALARLNKTHQQSRHESTLEARIQSFELAYRMQAEATDAFDVSRETKATRDQYGPGVQGQQLLIARRLIERGVRVVQCYHGDVQPWDSHNNIATEHRKLAGEIDGPIAALLGDLKRLDLLKETLVLIGGEFGRTPVVELAGGKPAGGRDHNHWGFSVVLAGGGVRGGMIYGATDEFGFKAIEKPVHVHDLHATMLHLLGFDHEKLTYHYSGRDFRLTDVHGKVIQGILA